jgi:hypothetical protein
LKSLQRVLVSIGLILLLGLPLACSAPGGSENSSTPGKSTTKSTIQKLMGLLPVSAMQSENETISFIDYAKIRVINGISVPTSYSEQDVTAYFNSLWEAGVSANGGTFHSGMGRYALQGPIRPENVGYGLANVDAEIASGIPPL